MKLFIMKAIFVLTVALVAIATASNIPAAASPSRTLEDDLQDFFDLLPVDKLTDLVVRYFTTDKEFQEAFAYLQGAEFAAVWDQFFALKEVKDVLNYLEEGGLAVYDLLNEVADFLGLNHVKPKGVKSLRAGGLSGFVDDALALLPLEELKALYEEKLKTSPEFKALFDKLFSSDFQKLVDFYQNSKEAQAMVQKLRDHGVDVDKFFELVAGFFGFGFSKHQFHFQSTCYSTSPNSVQSTMKAIFVLTALVAVATASSIPAAAPPSRTLEDDLQDFLNLLPVDKLTDLVVRYFTTDKEFQEAFAYLQGAEFAAVWNQFFALKEVKDVLNYLEEAGLAVYDLLNQVADFLGLNHVTPKGVKSLRAGGLSGFVDDALALLPLKELKALYEEKLKTSPEFKALFDKLFSSDFQKLVDFYQNSKEAQAMVQKLRDHGVDVDKFFELVAGFFGFGF
ncbi:uncharacterized protein LOC134209980 [Armigeres subalbatus]|uniref:uncharacterized protein LOC134209980 n=1 Tax=Armigeres subalbatus TaxID=124917 RepID=UPI002ED56EF8